MTLSKRLRNSIFGKYDCVHYAGHAFFDPQGPGRSGLLCAGREVLRGLDLAGISSLPLLVFFNACEAGRVRGRPAPPVKKASVQSYESAGVAEALMRGGIANYMSTYWPVGDDAAETFSETFYKAALAGSTIGSALLAPAARLYWIAATAIGPITSSTEISISS